MTLGLLSLTPIDALLPFFFSILNSWLSEFKQVKLKCKEIALSNHGILPSTGYTSKICTKSHRIFYTDGLDS